MRRLAFSTAIAFTPMLALAQVGHTPQRSPYRDLEYRMELTLFGGQFMPAKDPARVAPQTGPLAGLHWEMRLGGPAYFYARVAQAFTDRRVINPVNPPATRLIEERSVGVTLADVGFAMNLTGFKAWHGLVPVLGGGLGVASAFDSFDEGGYKFGTPFMFALRPGIKLVRRGRWSGRIDASAYLYRLRYPPSYFTTTTGTTPVLPANAERQYWKRNMALSIGLTYGFSR